MSNAKSLAVEFLYEYFDRMPEWLDVVEYVDENTAEEATQEFYEEVYEEQAAILKRIRFQSLNFLEMIEDEEL